MRLAKLSIKNFRSIQKAQDIDFSDLTVLIGKNNEGKSNFISALAIVLYTLILHKHVSYRYAYRFGGPDIYRYQWKRDFPISLQSKKGVSQKTTIKLEFILSKDDIKEALKIYKLKLPTSLVIEATFDRENNSAIRTDDMSISPRRLQEFLAEKIAFIYIPAVRTPEQAKNVMNETIFAALSKVEKNPDYQKAIEIIDKLRKPILKNISKDIQKQLSEFLPAVKDVKIELDSPYRISRLTSSFDIIINDGTPTSIDFKGDGVKSLATLGILKNSKQVKDLSIVAIEEPESHLHPGAIKQLNSIIGSLQNSNQVILTTHSPLFVNKQCIESNIIISNKGAKNADSIASIRDELGVVMADNLMNAKYILFVEGESDKRIIVALINSTKNKLKFSMRSGDFVIEVLHGASKLPQMLAYNKGNLSDCYAFMDFDKDGVEAVNLSIEKGLLQKNMYTLTKAKGKKIAEIEDLLVPDIYAKSVLEKFGINVKERIPKLNNSTIKWSDKMKSLFDRYGKQFDKKTEDDLKALVACCVEQKPKKAILEANKPLINNFIKSLDMLVK